jgi:hypothetical protein
MNIPFQTRREFLQSMSAAAAATLALPEPKLWANESVKHPQAKADACILLWMAGGMAAPETFDPKRYEPFEIGLPAEKILSTFPAIDTVVDGIKISKGLEQVANVLDRGTLIRSHVVADLGHILHSRHQYHWHTGYVPPQTVAAPHMGAWVARVLGPRNPAIPAFINIGQRLEGIGESEELKAFTTAGFLGSEYGPFNIPFPQEAAASLRPPKGMTAERFQARYQRYQELLKRSPSGEAVSDYHQESVLRSLESAHRLLSSPDRKAFDLSEEPKESFERYNTGRFGHDDRRRSRQHGPRPVAGQGRLHAGAEAVRPAPAFYGCRERPDVWRRHQTRLPLRRDGPRAALFDDQ